MLHTLFALGRLLWPFLRESVFGNASFKHWLKANLSFVCLFVMVLIVFMATTQLASLLSRERHRLQTMTFSRDTLQVQLHDREEDLQTSRNTVMSLSQELGWTRSYLTRANKPSNLPEPPSSISIAPTTRARSKRPPNNDVIDALKRWDAEHPAPLSPAAAKPSTSALRVLRP